MQLDIPQLEHQLTIATHRRGYVESRLYHWLIVMGVFIAVGCAFAYIADADVIRATVVYVCSVAGFVSGCVCLIHGWTWFDVWLDQKRCQDILNLRRRQRH